MAPRSLAPVALALALVAGTAAFVVAPGGSPTPSRATATAPTATPTAASTRAACAHETIVLVRDVRPAAERQRTPGPRLLAGTLSTPWCRAPLGATRASDGALRLPADAVFSVPEGPFTLALVGDAPVALTVVGTAPAPSFAVVEGTGRRLRVIRSGADSLLQIRVLD